MNYGNIIHFGPRAIADGDDLYYTEEECAYCYSLVTTLEVPGVDDDEMWEALAGEHDPHCEWVHTRAHRLSPTAVLTKLGLWSGPVKSKRKRAPRPHTQAEVARMPKCDMCDPGAKTTSKVMYDGKTAMGPWANMCGHCFKRYGVGLGLGKGQKLILKTEA